MGKSSRLRKARYALVILAFAGGGLLWSDVYTPSRIEWVKTTIQGWACWRAEGLVLQHKTADGVWATQGYSLYRSEKEGPFEKVVSIPPPFGVAWAGYSRTLRRLFGYQELVEVVPLNAEVLVAWSGGWAWRIDLGTGSCERVFKLRYFGPHKGLGVTSRIAVDDQGSIYWGEYVTAPGKRPVAAYRSDDEGRTWEKVYEFEPGEIRHIHGLEWDPYAKVIWLVTGDLDHECRIGYSEDRGETFTWVGQGSQQWRTCALVFMPDHVSWAMDAVTGNQILRWHRQDRRFEVVGPLESQAHYSKALTEGVGILGLARDMTSAYFVDDGGAYGKLVEWACPKELPKGPTGRNTPFPLVRLARGYNEPCRWVYLNPLRTVDEEAAIFRFASEDVLAKVAESAKAE